MRNPTNPGGRKAAVSVSTFRWTAYVTASAASAVACATTAEADIFYFTVNQPFNAAPGASVVNYFNLTPGNSFAFLHSRTSSNEGVAVFGIFGLVAGGFAGFSAGGYAYVSRLNFGANIGGANFAATQNVGTMAFHGGYGNDQWLGTGIGFIGFSFNGGAGVQFGWVRVQMTEGAPGNAFTVLDYAFADVGQAITAGQVPEPGSLGLLAVGGAGLLAWRRKRAQSKAALSA